METRRGLFQKTGLGAAFLAFQEEVSAEDQNTVRPTVESSNGVNYEKSASFNGRRIETIVRSSVGSIGQKNTSIHNPGASFGKILAEMHSVQHQFFCNEFGQQVLENNNLIVTGAGIEIDYDRTTATFTWKYFADVRPARAGEDPHNSITSRGTIRMNAQANQAFVRSEVQKAISQTLPAIQGASTTAQGSVEQRQTHYEELTIPQNGGDIPVYAGEQFIAWHNNSK